MTQLSDPHLPGQREIDQREDYEALWQKLFEESACFETMTDKELADLEGKCKTTASETVYG